jgi:hypothetical protein
MLTIRGAAALLTACCTLLSGATAGAAGDKDLAEADSLRFRLMDAFDPLNGCDVNRERLESLTEFFQNDAKDGELDGVPHSLPCSLRSTKENEDRLTLM